MLWFDSLHALLRVGTVRGSLMIGIGSDVGLNSWVLPLSSESERRFESIDGRRLSTRVCFLFVF